MKVIWQTSALAALQSIADYIARENQLAARRVARDLMLAGDSLTLFPSRGRRGLAPGTRELVLMCPYVTVYEVDSERLSILRVWHAAQDRP